LKRFQKLNVEIEHYTFAVGKADKEYIVEGNLKLSVKQKKPNNHLFFLAKLA